MSKPALSYRQKYIALLHVIKEHIGMMKCVDGETNLRRRSYDGYIDTVESQIDDIARTPTLEGENEEESKG